jgi:hypothetical protein
MHSPGPSLGSISLSGDCGHGSEEVIGVRMKVNETAAVTGDDERTIAEFSCTGSGRRREGRRRPGVSAGLSRERPARRTPGPPLHCSKPGTGSAPWLRSTSTWTRKATH